MKNCNNPVCEKQVDDKYQFCFQCLENVKGLPDKSVVAPDPKKVYKKSTPPSSLGFKTIKVFDDEVEFDRQVNEFNNHRNVKDSQTHFTYFEDGGKIRTIHVAHLFYEV